MSTNKLITTIILALVVAGLNWLFPEYTKPTDAPEVIEGKTRIVDGDSLYVDGYEVRLVGIDAPEGKQLCRRSGKSWPCGRQSAERLRALIGRERVRCKVEKRDQHRRLLAVCTAGRSELNRLQVKNGWAVSYGRYKSDERKARRQKRGIWAGSFMRPKEWRDRNF